MTKRVLVLGGYGSFGQRISRALAADPLIECVVGGRSRERAAALARELGTGFARVDARDPESLRAAVSGAFAVVHAAGPFQGQDYAVAKQCIQAGAHYVDLGDARAFVTGIERLHEAARRNGCLIVSGASSVPAVSAALVDALAPEFGAIEEIHTALSPGNRNPRGRATVRAILSYVGAPLRLYERGRWRGAYGWSEPQVVRFSEPVGRRRVYLCDVPDLELFPQRYGARTVSFRAGLQLDRFNRGLALLGWLRQRGLVEDPGRYAGALLAVSNWFRGAGDASGGLRVSVHGRKGRAELERYAELVARDDNGPAIPCSPAIALVRKWVAHGAPVAGAMPCIGLVTLDELRAELKGYDITLVMG